MQMSRASVHPAWMRALANRNFRFLWLGENISLLGDQFYAIALPWLIFQMTGSSLAFGTVLMVGGIPRALLMLVGGVLTDRFSPRAVMITSNFLRLIITLILVLFVAGQAVQLWVLFVIAFCFGIVDAFFHPAYRAMIPMIVDEDNLQASNGMMQSAVQLVQIIGPAVAGVLVNVMGIVLAFVFDAFTFLFTALMLLLMHSPPRPAVERKRTNIFGEIRDMLAFVRRDRTLPTIILVIAAVNLLFTGPLIVGTASLGRIRFIEGSAAFGAMLSTFAVGMLIGTFTAAVAHMQRAGLVTLLLVAVQGILMMGIGFAPTLIMACGLLLLIGCGAGFGNVTVITMTQKRVSKDMMGRFMSLIVLAEIGLTPISNGIAGLIADFNVTTLFVLAGGLLALTGMAAAMNRDLRSAEL